MRQTTKEALSTALEALLERRSIDKITVKDIVSQCGVNRQTFYYHFRDIYDLMEWSLMHSIERHIKESITGEMAWKEQIRELFHFFYLHRTVLLHGYDATNRIQYERAAVNWLTPMVHKLLESYPQSERVPEEKREFICGVYARGLTALLLEWIEEGLPDEQYVHLEDYFLIADGSMGHALEKFRK